MDMILSQSLQQQNSDAFTVLAPQLLSNATRNSGEFFNPGNNGIIIALITANKANSPTFQVCLQTCLDGTNWVNLVAHTAIAANGTAVYFIHPHGDKTATSKSAFTEMGTSPVPRRWRISLVYAGTPATDKMDTAVYAAYVK